MNKINTLLNNQASISKFEEILYTVKAELSIIHLSENENEINKPQRCFYTCTSTRSLFYKISKDEQLNILLDLNHNQITNMQYNNFKNSIIMTLNISDMDTMYKVVTSDEQIASILQKQLRTSHSDQSFSKNSLAGRLLKEFKDNKNS